jgi:uncharacterized HAD superfamily protein
MNLKERLDKAFVVAVDMDNTLCKGDHYTPEDCNAAIPDMDMIYIVNKLSDRKYIIIYTARKYILAEATLKWLDRWNIRYNAISFRKTNTDIYIDDRSFRPEELIQLMN